MTLTKEQRRKLRKRALNEAFKMPEEILKALIGYDLGICIILIVLRYGIGLEFSNPDALIGFLCVIMLYPMISVISSFFDIYKKLKKEEEEKNEKVNKLDGCFYQGEYWVIPKKYKGYSECFENLSASCKIKYYATFIKGKKTIKVFIMFNDNEANQFEEIEKADFVDFYQIDKAKEN